MVVTWNPDPILLSWNFITVRWYGIFFALAFISGGVLGTWILKRESKAPESLDRIMIHMILGTIIGARLGHCLFYEPGFYLANPLEILKIWKGGLASHGGGVGIILAIYIYARRTPDQPFFWILDRVGLATALGCVFIRLGNLFNSEIIGLPTHSGWGVIFSRVDMIPRHPTQLYESLAYFIVFLVLLKIYFNKDLAARQGFLSGATLIGLLPARWFIEILKENQSAFEEGWFMNLGQLLSIPLFLLGLYFMIRSRKQQHPG